VYIPETVYGHISGTNRNGRRRCRCVFLAQSDSVVSEIYTDLKGGHVTDIKFVEENAGHTQKLLSPKATTTNRENEASNFTPGDQL